MEPDSNTDIGGSCSFCSKNDFLPFLCSSCNLSFCQFHRFPEAHNCSPVHSFKTRNLSEASVTDFTKCTFANCASHSRSSCPLCGDNFCLEHRHPEEHICTVKSSGNDVIESKKAEIKKLVESKLGLEPKVEEKLADKPIPKKPKKTNPVAELMKLKLKAKGDPKIPTEKRVYVRVAFASDSENSAPMFFSKDAVVGRVLDDACKLLSLQNNNNKGIGKKLQLYFEDQLLDTSKSLGDILANGATLNIKYTDT